MRKTLFNVFDPDLAEVIQPLSGEYAFRRFVAEDLEFSSGFGVETILLIDFYKKYGLSSLVQVDMGVRVHRNKTLTELSKTSFMILQIFKYCKQIIYKGNSSSTLKVANNQKSKFLVHQLMIILRITNIERLFYSRFDISRTCLI